MPRQVDFKVPKVECTDGEEIPYTELIDVEKIQMTTKMTCEVGTNILITKDNISFFCTRTRLIPFQTAGQEDDVMQAGDLNQVLQHRVPGVHGRADRRVRRAGDDDSDTGKGAQEKVPAAGRLRAQAGQAHSAGSRGAETGRYRGAESNFHLITG